MINCMIERIFGIVNQIKFNMVIFHSSLLLNLIFRFELIVLVKYPYPLSIVLLLQRAVQTRKLFSREYLMQYLAQRCFMVRYFFVGFDILSLRWTRGVIGQIPL